ncbi:hypothetical protein SUGI_1132680 [Cryptomeria japonica]|uniref:uncharacterized protein LOC131032493 n=1 Tax=Cryptomeria japonica TaxID=3369 RepID=UPI00241476CD|nr:uncharacterized protein LOC131032493 [Cryptomeria japonica]XP_057819481.2 uncharacterized protein LOC131032493 [Cryptomeria japonica]GLJ53151.1 hypothetical protein SUGI_1132680 [Cryptomeria japonica]
MEADSKEVYPTQLDLLVNRMNCTNTDDSSITEMKSSEFTVDNDGFYDPGDDLAELHWLASFLEEPSLGNAPKPPVYPCFGAQTKDIHGAEQISDEFRNSSSISALESSSCSGNIPNRIPDVTASGKVRSITLRVPCSNWHSRSSSLAKSNPDSEICSNASVSANAAVSNSSDFLSSEQAKSKCSNRLCETDQGIEAKWEDATKVIKCMNCDTQKTAYWKDGPKRHCISCLTKHNMSVGHLNHFVSEKKEWHFSNKIFKRRQGIKKKEQGKLRVIKCMHCGTHKTPQWRAGPMGPKTLCNACGVRYRYGGLVPEYRPSASPTFSVDKHSNSHKKILEMIGQKEFTSQASEAKKTCSGSEVQASYMKPSQEVLENCPNSSLLANTAVCSGSDYFVSKQTKSDSLKEIPKSKQGIIRKGQAATNARKCVDCGNQKTPHRRAGTMDCKTPCNTSDVNSGRNSPEYRPVASPIFSVDKHSYSHKSVLERKAQKEFVYQEKQTHIASELQDSCAEPPQNGLENQPKSFLSADGSVCSGSDHFVSKQVNSDPLKKIQKTNQGIIRKVQKAIKARKCMHCSIKRTPQWRDGPMGPKTLCNACGVRYRSGKLLPEYRPAASPTFSATKHSNSHKKVLEMRSQKELAAHPS